MRRLRELRALLRVLEPFTVGDVTHLFARAVLTPHPGSDT